MLTQTIHFNMLGDMNIFFFSFYICCRFLSLSFSSLSLSFSIYLYLLIGIHIKKRMSWDESVYKWCASKSIFCHITRVSFEKYVFFLLSICNNFFSVLYGTHSILRVFFLFLLLFAIINIEMPHTHTHTYSCKEYLRFRYMVSSLDIIVVVVFLFLFFFLCFALF